MIHPWIVVLSMSLAALSGPSEDEPPRAEGPAAEEYRALVEQFAELGRAADLADQFVALAKKYPDEPVSVDALAWVVIHVREGEKPDEATEILVASHIDSERLGTVSAALGRAPSAAGERLLRALLEKSPHRNVQARACFHLASQLEQQQKVREAIQSQPASRRRFEQYYGKSFTRHLAGLDEAKLAQEIEQLYERVVRSYGGTDEALTQAAQAQLTELRHLAIGKPALEIKGEDIEGAPFKMSDYRGKVVVLDFWGHW